MLTIDTRQIFIKSFDFEKNRIIIVRGGWRGGSGVANYTLVVGCMSFLRPPALLQIPSEKQQHHPSLAQDQPTGVLKVCQQLNHLSFVLRIRVSRFLSFFVLEI